ncbi:MAG: helix-turn-helix transcriptional regulator [Dysgonamonadaceae bacterium]|jgi:transcriptional regulator with XRE-family HTH domain|nr:helix-turn-helix transcriptional regulator [Dysgonamonadaceae bacterium]
MTEKVNTKFNYSMSNEAILRMLGTQLRQIRLNKNLSQTKLGKSAGLSRSTIIDIENRGMGTMSSFIQILRVLEKIEILNQFITEAPVSPIQIARLRGKTRKRASVNRKTEENKEVSEW